MWHKPATTISTQKVAIMKYVRFKVTICLYLNSDNRARSLSALLAAIVNKDTELNA